MYEINALSESDSTESPEDTALLLAAADGNDDAIQISLDDHGANLNTRNSAGCTPLHLAVQNRHASTTVLLIQRGADLEATDNLGRTPLYIAAEVGNHEGAKLLLEGGALVEATNTTTQLTALWKAVEGRFLQVAKLLLEHGAVVDPRGPDGQTPLFAAVDNRDRDMIFLLLQNGADKTITDNASRTAIDVAPGPEILDILQTTLLLQGPSTKPEPESSQQEPPPLHHPAFWGPTYSKDKMLACFHHKATIIDFFVGDTEQRIEVSPTIHDLLYGAGPDVIMAKARGESLGDKKRSYRWYHLPANNFEWVEDLLSRHLADGKGRAPEPLPPMLRSLLRLSNTAGIGAAPSFVRPICQAVEADTGDPQEDVSKQIVAFIPFLHYETYQGLYAMIQAVSRSTLRPAGPDGRHRAPIFRPGKQPVVSQWLNDVQTTLQARGPGAGPPPPAFTNPPAPRAVHDHLAPRSTHLGGSNQRTNVQVPPSGLQNPSPGPPSPSPLPSSTAGQAQSGPTHLHTAPELQPQTSTQPTQSSSPPLPLNRTSPTPSITIPEAISRNPGSVPTEPPPRTANASEKSVSTHRRPTGFSPSGAPPHNPNWYLIRGYYHLPRPRLPPPLQLRRTLDQYSYAHLSIEDDRNKDQVISRYTALLNCPKLFMVDQLWLWIINEDTLITCLPVSWHSFPAAPPLQATIPGAPGLLPTYSSHVFQNDPLSVVQKVLRHLRLKRRAPITTARDLAKLITEMCVNVFDPHQAPGDFQFFDMFEQSISVVSDRATRQLQQFRRATMVHRRGAQAGPQDRRIPRDELSIGTEIELVTEIEDIRDELGTLQTVLEDQSEVLRDVGRVLGHLNKSRVLDSHLHEIQRMLKVADKTATLLYYLLDLEQKQASILEAHAAREQANIAASHAEREADQAAQTRIQSEEAVRQGKTVVLFTVVTIVFLPLSFMAAFFAINIDRFPVNENGSLELEYVLKYMLSISAGLSVPFIFIIFNQERVWRWLAGLRAIAFSLPVGVWISILAVVVSLVIVWTTSLGSGMKIALTIFFTLVGMVVAAGILIKALIERAIAAIEEDDSARPPRFGDMVVGALRELIKNGPLGLRRRRGHGTVSSSRSTYQMPP